MDSKPYDVWISMYNDELKTKYEEERLELRRISMIYCAFQIELDKLKASLSEEIAKVRTKLKRNDILEKCKNFSGLAQSVPMDVTDIMNKENELPKDVPFNLNELESEEFFIETPDTCNFFGKLKTPPPAKPELTSTSPVICKSFSRKTSPTVLYPVITHKVDKTPNLCGKKSDEYKTPTEQNDSNIMECSIIEDTPEINASKKTKLSKNFRKKRTQSKQKSTLTQMLRIPKEKKKQEIDSNDPSMSINKIINLLNESSGSETDAERDKSDETTINGLAEESPKKDLNKFLSFIQNYDEVPKKKREKSPEYPYHEVVRGKKRKNLKGWSCKDCEKYYEGCNLPSEELEKKKDQCSKHRSRFKPPEETYAGFWDLTFGPTPETQQSDQSIVYNYKRKS